MFKLAAIIGGVLVMASAALAGTLTSLGSTNNPTIGQTPLVSSTTAIDDRGGANDVRGRENEVRGRANEAGEDLRGPCDEAEHANDSRCTGVLVLPRVNDNVAEDRLGHDVGDDRGGDNSGPGSNSGPNDRSGGGEDSSGHGGGSDDGGHSGHGGQGRDD